MRFVNMQILITGFAPFDGRLTNASWLAAQSLASQVPVEILEMPVVWGAPLTALQPICERDCPAIIISMGEGKVGEFTFLVVAHNERGMRLDNLAKMPFQRLIDPLGPAQRDGSIDANRLCARLSGQAWPIRVSTDAGAFLCEETLYTLEFLRQDYAHLQTVVFVHLPPHGSEFQRNHESQQCDTEQLTRFAQHLHAAVLEIHELATGEMA